jgi:transposase-like protein
MGMLQRDGKAYLKHIPDTSKYTLINQIKGHISPKAKIISDEWQAYTHLDKLGYAHQAVNNSKKEYVRGEVHTQNIESLWSGLKRGIYGVYRIVSKKYLQAYADEYAFRYNNRKNPMMFDVLLNQVATTVSLKASQTAQPTP